MLHFRNFRKLQRGKSLKLMRLTFTNGKTEERPETETTLQHLFLSEKGESVAVAGDGRCEKARHIWCSWAVFREIENGALAAVDRVGSQHSIELSRKI